MENGARTYWPVLLSAMIASATVIGAAPARAQTADRAPCAVTVVPIDSASAASLHPDVLIRARATAQSVTFTGQPRVHVNFRGCGIRDTVRVLERTNLPKPVVSGQTYANVTIAVELYAYFDVECILAQLQSTAASPATCRRKP